MSCVQTDSGWMHRVGNWSAFLNKQFNYLQTFTSPSESACVCRHVASNLVNCTITLQLKVAVQMITMLHAQPLHSQKKSTQSLNNDFLVAERMLSCYFVFAVFKSGVTEPLCSWVIINDDDLCLSCNDKSNMKNISTQSPVNHLHPSINIPTWVWAEV